MANSPSQALIALKVEEFHVADRHRTRGQARAVFSPSTDLPISAPEDDIKQQVGELRHTIISSSANSTSHSSFGHVMTGVAEEAEGCQQFSQVVLLWWSRPYAAQLQEKKTSLNAGKRLSAGLASRNPAASSNARLPTLQPAVTMMRACRGSY